MALAVGVVLPDSEPELEGDPVVIVMVPLPEVIDAVFEADSMLHVDVLSVALADEEEEVEDGSSANCATMRISLHWSPIHRS